MVDYSPAHDSLARSFLQRIQHGDDLQTLLICCDWLEEDGIPQVRHIRQNHDWMLATQLLRERLGEAPAVGVLHVDPGDNAPCLQAKAGEELCLELDARGRIRPLVSPRLPAAIQPLPPDRALIRLQAVALRRAGVVQELLHQGALRTCLQQALDQAAVSDSPRQPWNLELLARAQRQANDCFLLHELTITPARWEASHFASRICTIDEYTTDRDLSDYAEIIRQDCDFNGYLIEGDLLAELEELRLQARRRT